LEVNAQEGRDVEDTENGNGGLEFSGDVCEEGDEELSTSVESESGKDVNADGSESEDIDGQLLDGDNNLSVKADKYLDIGLGINLSLWMIVIRQLFLEYDCSKESRTDFNEDGANSILTLGNAVGNGLGRVTAGYNGLGSTSEHVSHGRSV